MQYVVIPADVIGEVMNGQRTTLPVTFPAEVGSTIGLKTDPDKRPTCLMDVTACDADPDGYTIRLRLHVYEHAPRLLMPAGRPKGSVLGYTDKPYLSMSDEPEAVDEETQKAFTKLAEDRDKHRRMKATAQAKRDRRLLSVEERMVQAHAAARLNNVNVQSESYVLKRKIKENRPGPAVIHTLETLERRAFRDAA